MSKSHLWEGILLSGISQILEGQYRPFGEPGL